MAGVHVQFADSFSLIVEGSLNATGTDTNPIVFTSSRTSPSAGAWNTVDFKGAPNCSFVFEHLRVEYAVNGITVESQGLALVKTSEFFNCSESGIMIKGTAHLSLVENTIEHNKNGIVTDSSAHAGILILGNHISSNIQNGIYLTSLSSSPIYNVTFSSNIISSNGQNGIYISNGYSCHFRNATFSSNVVTNNGQNGIYRSCPYDNSPFHNVTFSSNTVSSNGQDGVYISGYSSDIYDVTFSSNLIMSNRQNGLHLYSASSPIYNVELSFNTVLSNGQTGIYLHNYEGFYVAIYDVTLSSNTVSSNAKNGIQVYGGHESSVTFDLVASKNTIAENKESGMQFSPEFRSNITENSISHNQYGVVYGYTTGNLATRNDIYSNTYGMNVTSGATVSAEYNYWGDTSGPLQASLNPEGKGNPVNGNGIDLDFIPFLTSPQGHINQRPVAALSVDKTKPNRNETVIFDATNSSDDGRIDYYFFDFGDGTNSSWTTLPIITHKYALNGTYYAAVTVMDDYGVTSTNAEVIKVQIIVVPEFPSFLILPLFMIATLLAVIVYRKKRIDIRQKIVL
jgi:parallel beta-helix repeat protein